MKNHDDFCALNQDLPTIRPINYKKSCSISRHFYLRQCYLPKSASNQIYFSLTFGIYTSSSSSSRLSIAQTCVLKYHPKHADSTKNYPLIQSLFFLIVDIVKFAVTFGLTSRMVTIRSQAHFTSETSRWQKREKLHRAIQCKKTTPKVMSRGSQSAKIWSLITNSTILMYRDI